MESHARLSATVGSLSTALDSSTERGPPQQQSQPRTRARLTKAYAHTTNVDAHTTGMSTACRTATPDGNAFCDGEDDATCDRDGLVEDIEQQ
eukprot:5477621-Prymnesium_polylepis.1